MVGAVILTSYFWAVANVTLYKAFTRIDDIRGIVGAVGPMFAVGSALFLPYAFNQIKSAFGASGVVAAAAARSGTATDPVAVGGVRPAPVAPLRLRVLNLSSAIDDATFAAAVAAIGLQARRDFQPIWGVAAVLTPSRLTLNGAEANVDTATDAVIYFGDASSDPTSGVAGAFGYHSVNYGSLPYGFVYLDVCAQYGEAWSCTLSHEVLELLADPTTVLTATGPAATAGGPAGQTVRYDLEVCDPTQGDSYKINNVVVSNFVSKAYFGMGGANTATNFCNLALAPFGVRPGGYVQYEDSVGSHQINGPAVDASRLAARQILGQYRRNARRVAAQRLNR